MSKIEQGILLAGGRGSRLGKFSTTNNKHLYPITDDLVIEYPIKTLKQMGVKDLTVIIGGEHFSNVVSFLEDGKKWGLNINFCLQKEPLGISDAINRCQPYLDLNERFITILGDNVFLGPLEYNINSDKAEIFLNRSEYLDLTQFGVMSIENGEIVGIKEKPLYLTKLWEQYAITGCYIFDQKYFKYFNNTNKSPRGEFEITDVIAQYLDNGELEYHIYNGFWMDGGSVKSVEKIREQLKQ